MDDCCGFRTTASAPVQLPHQTPYLGRLQRAAFGQPRVLGASEKLLRQISIFSVLETERETRCSAKLRIMTSVGLCYLYTNYPRIVSRGFPLQCRLMERPNYRMSMVCPV